MNPTACGVFMACFELSCRCQLSFRAHELIIQQCSNTSTCCNYYNYNNNYNNCSKNKSKWSSDRYPCKIDGCTGSRLGSDASSCQRELKCTKGGVRGVERKLS